MRSRRFQFFVEPVFGLKDRMYAARHFTDDMSIDIYGGHGNIIDDVTFEPVGIFRYVDNINNKISIVNRRFERVNRSGYVRFTER